MKKSILFTMFIILILFASITCGNGEIPLENTKWILESYGVPDNLIKVTEGNEITTVFSSSNKEVKGFGGCNYFSANYELLDNELFITQIDHPELYYNLTPGVMAQEREFLKLLSNTTSFKLEGGLMTIFCSGGEILLFRSE
jgi:heat shock protein HslJ